MPSGMDGPRKLARATDVAGGATGAAMKTPDPMLSVAAAAVTAGTAGGDAAASVVRNGSPAT